MKSERWLRMPSLLGIGGISRPVQLFSLVTFVYMLGWGIVIPFFPLYIKEVVGSYSSVGIVLAILPLLSVVWSILLGGFLDRISKRTAVISVLFGYLAIGPWLVALTSLFGFVLFRVYHSFLATVMWVSGESYVREHSGSKSAVSIGFWDMATGFAIIAGALVGSLIIGAFGWSILYSVSVFAGLGLLVTFFILPDGKRAINNGVKFGVRAELRDFWGNQPLVRLSLFSLVFVFGVSVLGMVVPLFLDGIGATLWQIGLVTAAYNIPTLLEPFFAATRRPHMTVVISIALTSGILAMLFFVDNIELAFALVMLASFAVSAAYPIMMGRMTRFMPAGQRGELSAVSFAVRNIGAALGPVTAGFIGDAYGIKYAFLLGSAVLLASLLFVRSAEL